VAVEGLDFPRAFVLVLPAYGEPTGEIRTVIAQLEDHIRIWLR
jgi:hypothetical protein